MGTKGNDVVEVLALAFLEPVVAIELELGHGDGVLTGVEVGIKEIRVVPEVGESGVLANTASSSHATPEMGGRDTGEGVDVDLGGEIEPLATVRGTTGGGCLGESARLHNPHELLGRMVEVDLDGGVDTVGGLVAGELELGDKVLVGHLREPLALVGI